MTNERSLEGHADGVLRKYRTRGLVGGLGLGLFVGILLSGPHFYDWSVAMSLGLMSGAALTGAIIGWLFASALVGGDGVGGGLDESEAGDKGGVDGGD